MLFRSGGNGGGGNGERTGTSAASGVSNTGGGGGGAENQGSSGSGGSGVVILRAPVAASATTGSPFVGTTEDNYLSAVTLLLHADGSNGSTSFTDSSTYARTGITSSGGTINTSQSKFGGSSLAFSGGNGIAVPYDSSLDFGNSDFAIEFWLYLNDKQDNSIIAQAAGSQRPWFIYSQINGGGDNSLSLFAYNGSGALSILPILGSNTNTSYFTVYSAASYNTGQWYHVAVSRIGNSLRSYVDGILRSSAPITGAITVTGQPINIGYGGASNMSGFFDDFRMTKGTNRGYTGATISVPTAAFPDANSSGDKVYTFTGSGSITF